MTRQGKGQSFLVVREALHDSLATTTSRLSFAGRGYEALLSSLASNRGVDGPTPGR